MPLSLSEPELRAWLRLSFERGLSASAARSLLAAIGLPQDIYASSGATLSRLVPADLARQLRNEPAQDVLQAIDRTLAWLQSPGHHLITLADAAYPPALLESHDPPLLLYANGDPGMLSRPALAVVGARSATPAGQENAKAFSRHLAQQGWCIVSGLALGIDTAAHQGALSVGREGGGTIAVLGTGIDIVFPATNRALAHAIAENGLLITEFPLGTRGLKHHFPRRNRIVAGLSRGVLVVEAARQSGSLITARLAAESGREVFAIPGSIHSPLSRGCHALIRQGARLVESGQDILEELGTPQRPLPHSSSAPRRAVPPRAVSGPEKQSSHEAATHMDAAAGITQDLVLDDEQGRVLAALGHDPVHVDALVVRTGLDLTLVNQALLELELAGVVARQDDGRYQCLRTS